MLKRKNEDSQLSETLTKKQKIGESLLHKLLLHPDIDQYALKCLSIKNIFSSIRVDSVLFHHFLDNLTKLTITIGGLLDIIRHSRLLKCLKQLIVTKDSRDSSHSSSLVLSVDQFPLLREIVFDQINICEVIMTTCPIEELTVRVKQNKGFNYPIKVAPTLRKVEAEMHSMYAKNLISSQPNLQTVKLVLHERKDKVVHMFNFGSSPDLENLCMIGCKYDEVRLLSLQYLKSLELSSTTPFVVKYADFSSLRLLIIRSRRILQPLVGSTKFPLLNIFLAGCDNDLEAGRIFKECVQRNQEQIPPYLPNTNIQMVFSRYFYCNNVTNITKLHFSYIVLPCRMNHVFVQNTPQLSSLILKSEMEFLHFIPRSIHLRSIDIKVTKYSMNCLCSLLNEYIIERLKLNISPSAWNVFPCHLLQDVTVLELLLYENGEDNENLIATSVLQVNNLSNLLFLYIDATFFLKTFQLQVSNLPLLLDIEFLFSPYNQNGRKLSSFITEVRLDDEKQKTIQLTNCEITNYR